MIAHYIQARRWFRAKARGLVEARIRETYPLRLDADDVSVAVVTCTYADGGSDDYVLPIAIASGDEAERLRKDEPHLVIGEASSEIFRSLGRGSEEITPKAVLYDALGNVRLLSALLRTFENGGTKIAGQHGTLSFRSLPGYGNVAGADTTPKPTKTEQTNTSIVFGNAFILKVVRQLDRGTSAELDMGAFLTVHGHASSPPVVGAIEIERDGEEPATVGVLHRFVANEGDAWTFTLGELESSRDPKSFVAHAALLGKRVGEMHVVLASGSEPSFAVGRLDRSARIALGDAVKKQAHDLASVLSPGDDSKVAARVDAFVALAEDPPIMRVHGDLHLGQILWSGTDFIIIDFEGEPSRSLAARKAKRSPLADVAGMLRSFDYAAAAIQRTGDKVVPWPESRRWYEAVANAFLEAYRSTVTASAALKTTAETFDASLAFYLLEKAIYELGYEANNRPDWIAIPQTGIRHLLDGDSTT